METDERDKAAAFKHPCGKCLGALLNELQFLVFRVSHGDDHPAALGKLSQQRFWNSGSGSCDEDGIEWRKVGEPKSAVSAVHMNIRIANLQKSL